MNEFDPPAIVREAESTISQLSQEIQDIHAAFLRTAKINLEQARELGAKLCLLKAQIKKTPQGRWLPKLKEFGISRTSAWEYMTLAKCSESDIFRCTSIRDAIKEFQVTETEEQEIEKPSAPESPKAGNWRDNVPAPKSHPATQDGVLKHSDNGEREPGDEEDEPEASPKKPRAQKPREPREEILDGTGKPVPDPLRDVFADEALPALVEDLENVVAFFRPALWTTQAGKLTTHYPFILIQKFDSHVHDALHELQLALEAIKAGLPYAPCPKCDGMKENGKVCKTCRGGGYVPEHKYKEACE